MGTTMVQTIAMHDSGTNYCDARQWYKLLRCLVQWARQWHKLLRCPVQLVQKVKLLRQTHGIRGGSDSLRAQWVRQWTIAMPGAVLRLSERGVHMFVSSQGIFAGMVKFISGVMVSTTICI